MRGRRLLGMAGVGAGAALAALTAGAVVERRVVRARRAGVEGAEALGGLTSPAVIVTADGGVRLHAEVDELEAHGGPGGRGGAGGAGATDRPTVVFVHGYALNLDCWHFQRERFRGDYRMVFYDQRSHGRSGRSSAQHATIDQLGHDLAAVLEQLVPDGPVVLVGHSMGGMSIMAFAEHYPEVFGERVVGVGLLSTTAGGLRAHRVLGRFVPDVVGAQLASRVVAGLARAPELVDRARRPGSNLGYLLTGRFAFGGDVPPAYVEFVDEMLAGTSFDVIAEFFPNFDALDKFTVLRAFASVPTWIVCGTSDVLTSVGHSRKMASRIPGATLVECPGAGHMVMLEDKDRVNAALEELFDEAEGQRAAS